MIKKSSLLFFFLVGSIFFARGQNAASPYSMFGLGTMANKALIYNKNMGGLGISNGQGWVLNNVNPALLPLNTFTTFDIGLYAERRNLNTTELKQSNTTGGLNYLTMGIAMTPDKWTISLGLIPYSNVAYNMTASGKVINKDNANADYQYKGSGGLNQVFLGSGWQIIPDFLYLGGRIGYTFGRIDDQTEIKLSERVFINENDSTGTAKSFQPSGFYRESKYSDFLFEGGLYIKRKIGKETLLNLGFVYEFASNLNTKRTETLQILDGSVVPPTDTILYEAKGTTYLPRKYGVGISFSKTYKWTLGLDYYSRNWAESNSDFSRDQNLTLSHEIILGGEFTPDFFSVKNYLSRVTYQMGISFEQTPVMINNQNIDDFGINFGVSLPVGSASIFNIGFKYGQMGTTSNGLVKEDYFKINLGMIFNDRSYGWYRNQGKYK